MELTTDRNYELNPNGAPPVLKMTKVLIIPKFLCLHKTMLDDIKTLKGHLEVSLIINKSEALTLLHISCFINKCCNLIALQVINTGSACSGV